jgi:DNA polymerase III subunit epsilon
MTGIGHMALASTPLAVVDIETTGLYPGGDRLLEIAVVRVESGRQAAVVLDTLVNPNRRVAATEIHGIRDEDVADAPLFSDIAPLVVEALRESVFASYNVYFDARFVREELRRAGVDQFPPHLCLMYLRPMLGLGRKCSLRDACRESGVTHTNGHHAAADALAAAELWSRYLDACQRCGVQTFSALANLRTYKFTSSFADRMLDASIRLTPPTALKLKPRTGSPADGAASWPPPSSPRQVAMATYWDALSAAVADLDITPHEVFYLKAKQSALPLRREELRWMHGRVFSALLADMCQDRAITDAEALSLSRVADALRELGWAPGDDPGLSS